MTSNVLLVLGGTLTALFAGLMFGFLIAVNPALGALPDRDYLAAMKSINQKIQNPFFMLTFIGPVILLPLATYQAGTGSTAFWLLLAASVLFIVGGVVVTIAANIPLNQRLDGTDLDTADAAQVRAWFEKPWNAWHLVRTLAGIAAVVLTFTAYLTD